MKIFLSALMSMFFSLVASVDAKSPFRIESLSLHSRLRLNVDSQTKYEYRPSTATGFEIFFPGLNFQDFGAPIASSREITSQWAPGVTNLSDDRLAGLSLSERDGGVVLTGRWRFPTGDFELDVPAMESFAFRDVKNGEIVLDFWWRPGKTKRLAQKERAISQSKLALMQARKRAENRIVRRIAKMEERELYGSLTTFCSMPVDEANSAFLKFMPARDPLKYSKWFTARRPDMQYEHKAPLGKGREDQHLRLAMKLYKRSDFALTLRTLKFMEKEFPNTFYRNEIDFLRANALYQIDRKVEALAIMNRIRAADPKSEISFHIAIFNLMSALRENATLRSLELFLWLQQYHPEHKLAWVFHLGAAEMLAEMKQRERAIAEYQKSYEKAPTPADKAESLFRIGHAYMDGFEYELALGAYFSAIEKLPDQANRFPSLWINRAEALYWIKEWDQAKSAFVDFLDRFGSHFSGWRASLRISEIEGRKPGAQLMESYRRPLYETINRYPFSPGATLARLRLLPCGDHGGFHVSGVKAFFKEEAEVFNGQGEVVMERYPIIKALSLVKTTLAFGEESLAVDHLIKEYFRTKVQEDREKLGGLFGAILRKAVLRMLEENRLMDALTFFESRKNKIPGAEYQSDFIFSLSRAASQLGLGKTALSLSDKAQQIDAIRVAQGRAQASTLVETKADDEMERNYTSAKALWIQFGTDKSNEIKDMLLKLPIESPHGLEREIILGLIEEKKGNVNQALGHALKAQVLLGEQEKSSTDNLVRILNWAFLLQEKVGNPNGVLALGTQLENELKKLRAGASPPGSLAELGLTSPRDSNHVAQVRVEILIREKKWAQAAKVYEEMITRGEGGNRALYEYGRLVRKSGGPEAREKAIASFEKILKSDSNEFWKKLAEEALVNEGKAMEGKKKK